MIYKNRTRECGIVTGAVNSYGTVPLDGTQRDGSSFVVEESSWYLRQFRPTGAYAMHGTYQICYDYYSNGELTDTQCTVQVW